MSASTKKEYVTFVKGLVTEAGPLAFPENASIDEENCVLNRNGSRQRRLGMDFEEGFSLVPVTLNSTTALTSHRWENAANNANYQFVVTQTGNILRVFDANSTSISNAPIATITLAGWDQTAEIQTANGSGYLFLTNGVNDPAYLAYDPSTNTVTTGNISLLIRDVFGVDDGLAIDTRPATLSAEHEYNLRNQGWPADKISAYFTATNTYPANNQQWFVGKDTNDDFQPALLNKQDFGTTPAPKGRIVINAFTRSDSRTAATGLALPSDVELGRPSSVAFAFERLFFAGVKSSISASSLTQPNMTGFVFYTRTVRTPSDFGRCYPEADPTSEVDSELVDTDGGFINIPSSGQIYKIMAKGNAIIVFAEQGVWMITGDDGGFRATSNQVVKLTDFGAVGANSIVEIESGVMYWNRGGIYEIQASDAGVATVNITESTIQRFYNSIGLPAKRTAKGTYDPVNRRVMWMYNSDPEYDATAFKNKYDKELVLDTVLGAFYKHSISALAEPSPYIAGYVECPYLLRRQEGVATDFDSVTKYLTVQFVAPNTGAAAITFSYYRNTRFRDWQSLDMIGKSYVSFLETGWETADDTARNKQAPYIFCHFRRSERTVVLRNGQLVPDVSGGCILQSRWDWSDSAASNKWSSAQQVYRLQKPLVLNNVGDIIDYGQDVITSKSRLPGRGKALSLRFESEEGKDFYIYGWAIKYTGNSYV